MPAIKAEQNTGKNVHLLCRHDWILIVSVWERRPPVFQEASSLICLIFLICLYITSQAYKNMHDPEAKRLFLSKFQKGNKVTWTEDFNENTKLIDTTTNSKLIKTYFKHEILRLNGFHKEDNII